MTARWEIEFNPVKRFIRGEHQPTISYFLPAPSMEAAKAEAVRLIRIQHAGASYRFHRARRSPPSIGESDRG